ncbi:MAG: TIGR03808 family TAT-translocated repetitive protein [Rhizobiales bacterium]|nr:TIGR03808 family TAT-translocated repetitive protein [Hyphomicrobiales bacterium]
MPIDRRRLLTGSLAGAAILAAPVSAYGLDAAQFGVRPGAPDDQSRALQRAIDEAARRRTPLMLAPGVYRAGDLKLPSGAHVAGVRGATRLMLTRGPSLLSSAHAETVTLSGLTLEGGNQPLAEHRGLVHFNTTKSLRVADCVILAAGGNAIAMEQCDGEVTHNAVTGAADNALFCIDSRGVSITANIIRGSGNGGIRVWQSDKRRDGSLIADNQIEDTAARAGGSGQNGNAINVFRAADVIVRGNHIRKAAFSAIRGAAASNIQIVGNNCAALDEVAIYSEFDFENALIADNTIDGARAGISVTNFKEGGRLAMVRGNVVRNIAPRQDDKGNGVGIGVEADSTVTGNTVEKAANIGISAGWGEYLRDVIVQGNVVKQSGIGVAVSVVKGAGTAVIAGNVLAGSRRAAIVGMEWNKVVTGDLALAGAERYPQLRLSGNQVM